MATQEGNEGGENVVHAERPVPPVAPAPAGPPDAAPAGETVTEARTPLSLVLVASVVGLAVIVGIGILLASNNGGGPVTPAHHEGDQVTIAGQADDFARPDDPAHLGDAAAPLAWAADAGQWGVETGNAFVSVPPATGRAVTTTALGGADGEAEVKFSKVADGGGLVFRYQDPANYWSVVAVPVFATWAVLRVVNGREQIVANTGLTNLNDDIALGVRLRGSVIDVVLDGQVMKTITDPTLRKATRVGLTAKSTAGPTARFDRFTVASGAGPKPSGSTG